MRVVIAEDSGLVRQGLVRLLTDEGIEVVAEVDNTDDLLRRVDATSPDVAIVDIRMPPTHTNEGLLAAERIREGFPTTGVLVLSQHVEVSFALRLLDGASGGIGYLLKDRVLDAGQLADAVRRVAEGDSVVDPGLVSELITGRGRAGTIASLTERELEVLASMAQGLSDRGIAERLYVSDRTVETHVRHILTKLDLPVTSEGNRRVLAVLTYLRS